MSNKKATSNKIVTQIKNKQIQKYLVITLL